MVNEDLRAQVSSASSLGVQACLQATQRQRISGAHGLVKVLAVAIINCVAMRKLLNTESCSLYLDGKNDTYLIGLRITVST